MRRACAAAPGRGARGCGAQRYSTYVSGRMPRTRLRFVRGRVVVWGVPGPRGGGAGARARVPASPVLYSLIVLIYRPPSQSRRPGVAVSLGTLCLSLWSVLSRVFLLARRFCVIFYSCACTYLDMGCSKLGLASPALKAKWPPGSAKAPRSRSWAELCDEFLKV